MHSSQKAKLFVNNKFQSSILRKTSFYSLGMSHFGVSDFELKLNLVSTLLPRVNKSVNNLITAH